MRYLVVRILVHMMLLFQFGMSNPSFVALSDKWLHFRFQPFWQSLRHCNLMFSPLFHCHLNILLNIIHICNESEVLQHQKSVKLDGQLEGRTFIWLFRFDDIFLIFVVGAWGGPPAYTYIQQNQENWKPVEILITTFKQNTPHMWSQRNTRFVKAHEIPQMKFQISKVKFIRFIYFSQSRN